MIRRRMPSPIGHLLAGAAVAWLTPTPARAAQNSPPLLTLTVVAAALATLPDLDLLVHPLHRTATHSLFSAAAVFIIATAVTGWVTPGAGAVRIGVMCAAAWGSHQLLDWMGTDTNAPRGIQWFWPFSERWFISGWDLFPPTERRNPLSAATLFRNAWAALVELTLLGGLAALAWRYRARR
jgi:membrane-bound metal-dependent hydrolase YbcI (DUF457 family)